MRIRKIVIENFGSIDYFEQKLDKNLALIRNEKAPEIMLAVCGVLSYPTKSLGDFNSKLKKNTNITIYTDNMDDIERLNNMNIMGVSKESLACSIFFNDEKDEFSKRLMKYKLSCDYYKKNEFRRITDSFGDTNAFRWHLGKYIKHFSPVLIDEKKNIEMVSDRDGVLYLRKRGIEAEIRPDPVEKLLLELSSFIALHNFWEEAAELRTLDPPEMPIMIGNIAPIIEGNKDMKTNKLKSVLNTKSQAIIFENQP